MPASRVESESKPEPKRWESDDYKADLTAHPEEIKDLCPIVITTIDCRATRFNVPQHGQLRAEEDGPEKT